MVGAGLSGLAAARALRDAGHEVVVFEKSRGLGGRIASRRVGDAVVDHGAPALDAPPGSGFRALVDELAGPDLIPFPGGITGTPPPDAPMAHPVAFADGLTQLAKRMARDLEVVRGVRIAALRASGDGYEIGDEQGNGHGRADAVVVSAPAPQAADLLERSPEPAERVAALRALTYHPAVMAVLGLRTDAPPRAPMVYPADGPLAVVSAETWKGRGSAGVVPVVARLTPPESARALDALSDEDVLGLAVPAVREALGVDAEVAWSQVKRWRYGTVAARGDVDALNPRGTRIVVCGDALCPPGMAAVAESGRRAAARLAEVAAAV